MQIPLKLLDPPAPSIKEGVIGPNEQALRELAGCCMGRPGAYPAVFLWGAPGSGKTYWLAAWARELNQKALYADCKDPDAAAALEQCLNQWSELPSAKTAAGPDTNRNARPAAAPGGQQDHASHCEVVLADNVDCADEKLASLLFRIHLALGEHGARLICASSQPPAHLKLREDLRTRLGAALIFELKELDDDAKRQALRDRAGRTGLILPEEIINYLMTRLPRDLGLMIRVIDSLDDYALAKQRAATIPLLKELLDSVDATRPI